MSIMTLPPRIGVATPAGDSEWHTCPIWCVTHPEQDMDPGTDFHHGRSEQVDGTSVRVEVARFDSETENAGQVFINLTAWDADLTPEQARYTAALLLLAAKVGESR